MAPRVRVGTRLDPETERPRLLAWAAANKRTEAEAIRLLVLEALDAHEPSRTQAARYNAVADVGRRHTLPPPADPADHPFVQGKNPLKCGACGVKVGDHR